MAKRIGLLCAFGHAQPALVASGLVLRRGGSVPYLVIDQDMMLPRLRLLASNDSNDTRSLQY